MFTKIVLPYLSKIIVLYLWGNCIYFAYHFISKNQNFDSFIAFFIEVYSFEWTKSLGLFGGFIQIGLTIILLIYMGVSIITAVVLFWKLFTSKIDLDKDSD
tara:strand:- start:56 stop:358 length:303 start_codon:yes stop_codon:yes gene_type:complete